MKQSNHITLGQYVSSLVKQYGKEVSSSEEFRNLLTIFGREKIVNAYKEELEKQRALEPQKKVTIP